MPDITVIHTGPFLVNTLIIPVSGKYVLIVDPAACELSGDKHKITSYIAGAGLVPVAVVLTHGHFDHVSGLPALKNCFPDIPVVIHKNDREMIGFASADVQSRCLAQMGLNQFLPAVSNLPEPSGFLDDGKTLCDCIPLDSEFDELKKWKVIHTPGHTPGSVCLYNEADRCLVSGDTLFYHSFGRTDLYGGNESDIYRSLDKLRSVIKGDTLVYPGHEYYGFRFDE